MVVADASSSASIALSGNGNVLTDHDGWLYVSLCLLTHNTHKIEDVAADREAASAREGFLIRQHNNTPHEEMLRRILKSMHAEAFPVADHAACQLSMMATHDCWSKSSYTNVFLPRSSPLLRPVRRQNSGLTRQSSPVRRQAAVGVPEKETSFSSSCLSAQSSVDLRSASSERSAPGKSRRSLSKTFCSSVTVREQLLTAAQSDLGGTEPKP